MKFICFTLLIISGITNSGSEQYKVVGPADPVFAIAGGDVILPCSVKPNISVVDMRVEWFRLDHKESLVHLYDDHGDRNTEQIKSYRGRSKLYHEELQRGNASLKLSSVQISDEGRYKCFIQSKSWYDDATVNVSVKVVVGSHPVITVDGFDRSGGLHLQCESKGWIPEPDLEWLDSEGVSLSSETTETHRNKNGFSVRHSITIYDRESKIHCRVKLRHHMLEAQIITSSNMFNLWMTSVILISVTVVLSVIAGILLVVLVYKYREHSQLLDENRRIKQEQSQTQDVKWALQDEISSEKIHIQYEKSKIQRAHKQLLNEKGRIQQAHKQLLNKNRRIQHEQSQLQNAKNRIQHDYEQLLQSQKMIIENVITHLRTHRGKMTLNADSAHPDLNVFDGGKQVEYVKEEEKKRDKNEEQNDRFNEYLGVLGKDGYSSGCFYFEVQVKELTMWDLGVVRESVKKKGKLSLSPDDGYWTVGMRQGKYRSCEPYGTLSLNVEPQRVGVFVDYEVGLVSFYDVESMCHIHSYTGQPFEENLYLFVCLGDQWSTNNTPLIICHDLDTQG